MEMRLIWETGQIAGQLFAVAALTTPRTTEITYTLTVSQKVGLRRQIQLFLFETGMFRQVRRTNI